MIHKAWEVRNSFCTLHDVSHVVSSLGNFGENTVGNNGKFKSSHFSSSKIFNFNI